jgi:porin
MKSSKAQNSQIKFLIGRSAWIGAASIAIGCISTFGTSAPAAADTSAAATPAATPEQAADSLAAFETITLAPSASTAEPMLSMDDAATTAPAAAPAATPAPAPLPIDYSGDLWTRPALTGDWWGLRNNLEEKGITVNFNVVQVYQGVVNGGFNSVWQYGGRDDLTINLNTQEMGLWPGGFLNLEAESNFGNFLGVQQTGAILPTDMNGLFPLPNSHQYDLSALNYMQFIAPQIGFVAGKLATITDTSGDMNNFAHGKGDQQFMNTAFCFDPILAISVPYSTLGAGIILIPTSDPKQLIITASAFDAQGTSATSGFDTAFNGGTGFNLEGRYTTNFFNLTGHQLLGGVYSDKMYTSLDQGLRNIIIPRLPIEQSDGTWAVYYNFDQYIYQPDPTIDRGLGVFGRFGYTNSTANPLNAFYSIGLGGKGLIPGRDLDQCGLGYYYMTVSTAQIPATLGFHDSQGVEAYYQIAITPWMQLTPDIQVIQPSQVRTSPATVLGVRLNINM